MAPVSPPVDARADRTVQGACAVILLSGFVFRQIWIVPGLGVLVAVGAVLGPPGSAFHRAFSAFVAPRLSAPKDFEEAVTVRVQDGLVAALLGVATLTVLISLNMLAWVIALAAAGVAAIAATTGIHLGLAVRDRIRRRT